MSDSGQEESSNVKGQSEADKENHQKSSSETVITIGSVQTELKIKSNPEEVKDLSCSIE